MSQNEHQKVTFLAHLCLFGKLAEDQSDLADQPTLLALFMLHQCLQRRPNCHFSQQETVHFSCQPKISMYLKASSYFVLKESFWSSQNPTFLFFGMSHLIPFCQYDFYMFINFLSCFIFGDFLLLSYMVSQTNCGQISFFRKSLLLELQERFPKKGKPTEISFRDDGPSS